MYPDFNKYNKDNKPITTLMDLYARMGKYEQLERMAKRMRFETPQWAVLIKAYGKADLPVGSTYKKANLDVLILTSLTLFFYIGEGNVRVKNYGVIRSRAILHGGKCRSECVGTWCIITMANCLFILSFGWLTSSFAVFILGRIIETRCL